MKLRLAVLAVGAVTLVAIGVTFALRPTAVSIELPRYGSIKQTVVVSGQVMPPAEVRLASFVSSTALEVLAREGEHVARGQLLLLLDEQDAKASLDQARANLAAARAGSTELARLDAPQAETELRRAEVNLVEARRRLEREQNLFDAGVTGAELLEDARTAEQVAASQRDAAQLQLRAASGGGSQSVRAQASVALAQAQLARAEIERARHQVRAPVDGIVITRRVEPGDAVLSGSALFVLSATGATRLRVEPDERNLALLALGQAAVASAEAFPRERFAAKVQYIAPAVDAARGTVEVHLLVDAPPTFLRQSMTISAEIIVAEKKDALVVSRGSIYSEKADPYVLTLPSGTSGRVRRTPIELGLLGDEVVEVVKGLSAQDAIVTAPAGSVQAGDKVRTAGRKRRAGTDSP